jgi:hypothetical protein
MLANVRVRTRARTQLLVVGAADLMASLTPSSSATTPARMGPRSAPRTPYDLIAHAPGDEIALEKADNHWTQIKRARG